MNHEISIGNKDKLYKMTIKTLTGMTGQHDITYINIIIKNLNFTFGKYKCLLLKPIKQQFFKQNTEN